MKLNRLIYNFFKSSILFLVILATQITQVFADPRAVEPAGPTGPGVIPNSGGAFRAGTLPGGTGVVQGNNVIQSVATVIRWGLGFVGIVIFLIFLFAGFQYATAGGDEAKTKSARSMMVNAVIGMIIVFLAFVISNAVLFFAFTGVA